MSHTEGKLEYSEERPNCILSGQRIMGSAAFEADALRLVACWNSCDGLPTDLLEQMVNPTSTYTALLKERNDLVKERDELVGILRRTVKYANRKPFNLTKEIDAVLTKYPEAS